MTNSTPTLVVSAALDSTSLFKGSAIGASATVAGLAALLIASQALSSLSTDIKETMTKNILFSLYNGESYGYIGSSRFVTELREGRLPVTMQNSSLSFADVEAVIEVGHLGSRGRDPNAPTPLYVHRDPTPQSEQTTDAMIEALEEKSDDGREVELATAAHLLPPGSLHSWLRWGDRHLPHVHIADHNSDGFTNDYYGSFLDDAKNLGVYDLLAMQHLCSASTVLARSLYLIAGGTEHLATTINADCTALKGLVTSLTVSMDSEYVRDITNGTECAARGYPGSADNQPLSLYVGVAKQRPQCGSVAYVAYLVLMRALTKTAVPSIDDMGNCGTEGYMWLDGACYHSTQTAMGRAISPAFLFNTDTGAHEIVNKSFSMWTESEWSPDTPYTMAFVAESPSERLVAMVTGLATSFLRENKAYTNLYFFDTVSVSFSAFKGMAFCQPEAEI
ncbi:hypothetical protein SARC_00371 [Sphaeroforma arctica JP610]|uniref:Nicastrin n=1 Tax=Sphaeroforma arctica JP610 TaxID=667725 RepID=A0A0L0GEW5_9EUKA|nr:hypothetical protein SARC_00371 [Sphaeroforma arctica JP610]KNC87547.1 hypothetical protein SARC_00371 [Sphaeroforma arctica JP610]|eukprot:XP_014161449.1 hypothetical protein SARC_00371 [Sphaeroforma arctica JP610]